MKAIIVLHFLLLFNYKADAFQFRSKYINKKHQIKFSKLELETLQLNKNLTSGLKTELLYVVQLKYKKTGVLLGREKVTIRYDLWDELYLVKDGASKVRRLKNLADVVSLISSRQYTVDASFFNNLKDEKFKVSLALYVNPIEKEKSKKIKKWLASKNMIGSSASSSRAGLSSVVNGVFNKVVLNDLNADIYGASKVMKYTTDKFSKEDFFK